MLHVTDVTLREVSRQLADMERELTNRANKAAKDLRRWNARYRRNQHRLPVPERLSGPSQPSRAFCDFERTVRHDWHAREHKAANLSIGPVLDWYFAGKPPFDTKDSKEFPDAIALLSLENWCVGTQERMYVVSKDKAVLRAADESEHLIGIESLDRLLALVASAESHDMGYMVLSALEEPQLLNELRDNLSANIGWVGSVYIGDRFDGEVVDMEIAELDGIEDVTVLRVEQGKVLCVAHVKLLVSAEIAYTDLSDATWDKEDQRYFGGKSLATEIQDRVEVKIVVELARDGEELTLSSAQFLTRDLMVTDDFSDGYPYK